MMKRKRKFYRKKLPNVFTKEQLVKLFRIICNRERKVRKIFNTRTSVACFLGFICGLRRSEVCHLKKEDVDFEKGELKVVNGKNGKDRIVPLPPTAQRILARWFRINKDTQWVFHSRVRGKDHQYNARSLEIEIRTYLARANLLIPSEKDSLGRQRHRYAFHTLRHTYATYLWNRTGDILTVKEALGHSRIQTTMVYTHVSPYKLKEKVNEAFSKPKVELHTQVPNFTDFNSLKQEMEILKSKQLEDPIKVLQLRLVKGEINSEEYQKLLDRLKPVNPIAF